MVSSGLYKYIRHPQYLAFSISGFGLLLLWPRYLMLLMYVTMLFIYYLLAKHEENECLSKFGKPYAAYLGRTYMFFPVNISRICIFHNASWLKNHGKTFVFISYILILFISLLFAQVLNIYSIKHLYSVSDPDSITISISRMDKNNINELLRIAKCSSEYLSIEKSINESFKTINYIYTSDNYISELPMKRLKNAGCHIIGNKSKF
jgi:hypothetical protein